MKKVLLATLLIFIFIFNANAHEVYIDNKALCERTKGIWRIYNNSCADNCKNKFGNPVCTSYQSFTCDCGENRCWDESKCISDKIAKIAYDKILKQQEEARKQELKNAGIDPNNPEEIALAQISQSTKKKVEEVKKPETTQTQNPTIQKTTQDASEVKLPPVVATPSEKASEELKLAMENPDVAQKLQEKQKMCEKQNGTWIEFPNGCADNCASKVASVNMCTQNLTKSCKCGDTKCWDNINNTCVELEEYKKGLTVF